MRADRARAVKARLLDLDAVNLSLGLGGVPGRTRTPSLIYPCRVRGCGGQASLFVGSARVMLGKCKACEKRAFEADQPYSAADVIKVAQLARDWTWDQAIEWAEQLAATGTAPPARPQDQEQDSDADDLALMHLAEEASPELWSALKKIGADPAALSTLDCVSVLDPEAEQPSWTEDQYESSWVEQGKTLIFDAYDVSGAELRRRGYVAADVARDELDWVKAGKHSVIWNGFNGGDVCYVISGGIEAAALLPCGSSILWIPRGRDGMVGSEDGSHLYRDPISCREKDLEGRIGGLVRIIPREGKICVVSPRRQADKMGDLEDRQRDLVRIWEKAGRKVEVVSYDLLKAAVDAALRQLRATALESDACQQDQEATDADADAEDLDLTPEAAPPIPAEDPLFAEMAARASPGPVRPAPFWEAPARDPVPAAPRAAAPRAAAPPPAPKPVPVPVPVPPSPIDFPDAAAEILRLARQLDAAQLAAVVGQLAELAAARAAKQPQGSGSGSGSGAVGFVRHLLAGGKKIPGAEVTRLARLAGHSREGVKAAKAELGIVAETGSPWTWSLPASVPSRPILRSLPKTPV